MSGRNYRSNHEALSSATPPKARKIKKIAAIPVALAAVTSMIFTAQSASADQLPKVDKLPKANAENSPQQSSVTHSTAAVLRAKKYTVVAGDTLRSIAQIHGISSAELLAANGLSWKTMMFAGQQLNIPASTSGTESAEVGESITRHNVASGETLEAIARSYGVQPRAIMTANGLDRSSRLVVGQRLVIPDAGLMSSMPAVASA
ncbi:LysM repeat protein [Aurantimicrobium minutum]|uniref:LysM peptidoglycan-binding domain-containing protein n=1 Tax=Aurantimicrobium minutum TaxID=708131 RepID=UPI0024764411|nr:LysM peptidoglycan-binding domain-containing protein [Aurantimicrobium minutum]MDH6255213.1 LysM repeat protein [Aurantimicrobium minutum]MDH6409345.1 LysM repeat protein [Aurantimicrobium minutum]MDH6424887.1 LysM repeat protein [Aurantimicrobium minutum]